MKAMILAVAILSASSAVVFAEGPASGPSSQTKTDHPAQRRVGVAILVLLLVSTTEPAKPASAAAPGGIPAEDAEPKK